MRSWLEAGVLGEFKVRCERRADVEWDSSSQKMQTLRAIQAAIYVYINIEISI